MSLRTHLGYLRYAPRILWKRGASPLYFVFFVTKNCNSRCGHCLLGSHIRHTGELTFDEIAQVSASMDDMIFFTPTGGEPFLRQDLGEIVKVFYKNNHVLNCGIPSNGSLTARDVEISKYILDNCPHMDLHIDISIDGIGPDHDRIRGFPGLFERAARTYKELRQLEKHYHNFSVCVQISVSGYNHEMLKELYAYLKQHLGVNTVFTLLFRGGPKDPGGTHTAPIDPRAAEFDIRNYEAFHQLLEEENYRRELTGYYKLPFGDFINAKRIVRPKLIAKTVRTRQYQIPCYAGWLGGAMFANGDVLACELLEDRILGNVRDYDYDFKRIWFSKKGNETRAWIRDDKCFCTYECQYTVNILFNPMMYPQVLAEWAKLKLAKARHRITGGAAPAPVFIGDT